MHQNDITSDSNEYEKFRCFKCGRVLFFAKIPRNEEKVKLSIKCLRKNCGIFNKFTL